MTLRNIAGLRVMLYSDPVGYSFDVTDSISGDDILGESEVIYHEINGNHLTVKLS